MIKKSEIDENDTEQLDEENHGSKHIKKDNLNFMRLKTTFKCIVALDFQQFYLILWLRYFLQIVSFLFAKILQQGGPGSICRAIKGQKGWNGTLQK